MKVLFLFVRSTVKNTRDGLRGNSRMHALTSPSRKFRTVSNFREDEAASVHSRRTPPPLISDGLRVAVKQCDRLAVRIILFWICAYG
jgi:hypothetical protein